MKSVLIITTPKNCKSCPLNKCPEWVDQDTRPEGCRLRRLPQKIPQNIYDFECYENGKAAGWNRCLDEIGG